MDKDTTKKRITIDTRQNGNEYKAFQVSSNGFESWREVGPRAWKYLQVEDVSTEKQRLEVAWFDLFAFLKKASIWVRVDYNLKRTEREKADPFAALALAESLR